MLTRRSILALVLALAAGCGGAVDPQPKRADAAPVLAALAATDGGATRELRLGRLTEARARLERELASDPDSLAALNDLAVSYYLDERFDAARQLLEEVLARGAAREQQAALVNLGELYAIDGYLSAAQAHLASARAIDPARAEPAYALACLADVRGDGAAAVAAMREALALDDGGATRRGFAFVYPDERTHLDALVAEATGDSATADARWRELRASRFPALAQAAQRHLEGP